MTIFIIILASFLIISLVALFCILYRIYRITFYSRRKEMPDVGDALGQDQQEGLKSIIYEHIDEYLAMPYEPISVTSHDGLTLRGKFHKNEGSKKAVIIFHGYKSNIPKDASIITKHCYDKGFNVIAVNQRGHSESDGHTITFGTKERLDCKAWVDRVTEILGEGTQIILFGISMGGATVMMASALEMPAVKGIISDCGFSSPREMLRTVLDSQGAPTDKVYPLLRLSGRIFAGFDPDKVSAIDELRKSTLPITIIHSDGDKFVPCEMAKRCFEASGSANKQLIIIKDAGHALSYFFDKEKYLSAVDDMLSSVC